MLIEGYNQTGCYVKRYSTSARIVVATVPTHTYAAASATRRLITTLWNL